MSDDFVETCRSISRRLTALLPSAEAIDRELADLIPPRPKRRSNGSADTAAIFNALRGLDGSVMGELAQQITDAIRALEEAAAERAQEERELDLQRLEDLQAEAENLRQRLGLAEYALR